MFDYDYLSDALTLIGLNNNSFNGPDHPTILNDNSGQIGPLNVLEWDYQIQPDNCAVEAERAIINAFIGTQLSQEEAMYISASNGWYQPGAGTAPADVGNMMELYNIPNHSVVNANIQDLANELAMGHGIIVGVDAQELWDSGPLADIKHHFQTTLGIDFGDSGANHAIVVTGMDLSNPSNPMVIINDSGAPDGEGHPYPMDKFLNAWKDSNCYYTATDLPLPDNNIVGGNTFDLSNIVSGIVGFAVGTEIFSTTGDFVSAVAAGKTIYHETDIFLDETFGNDAFIVQL